MSWYDRHCIDLDLVRFRGRLSDVERVEAQHDFITTTAQRFAYGAAAVLGAAAGSLAAPGLMSISGDRVEKAERVTFCIDDKGFDGWLWELPFKEGDKVDVIARPTESGIFEVLAVRRERDCLVAIYPHLTSGRKTHARRTIKCALFFWLFCSLGTLIIGFFQFQKMHFFRFCHSCFLFTARLASVCFFGLHTG